jgi:hypothetical protein
MSSILNFLIKDCCSKNIAGCRSLWSTTKEVNIQITSSKLLTKLVCTSPSRTAALQSLCIAVDLYFYLP